MLIPVLSRLSQSNESWWYGLIQRGATGCSPSTPNRRFNGPWAPGLVICIVPVQSGLTM